MSPARIGGIVLLVVGVIMLIYGLNASHSVADQLSGAWSGRFTERTTWYIIGGIATAVAGALVLGFGGRRRRD